MSDECFTKGMSSAIIIGYMGYWESRFATIVHGGEANKISHYNCWTNGSDEPDYEPRPDSEVPVYQPKKEAKKSPAQEKTIIDVICYYIYRPKAAKNEAVREGENSPGQVVIYSPPNQTIDASIYQQGGYDLSGYDAVGQPKQEYEEDWQGMMNVDPAHGDQMRSQNPVRTKRLLVRTGNLREQTMKSRENVTRGHPGKKHNLHH